ncbi:MAG TPA: hypothetical protein VFF06_00910 [Polyangia bacterium]|nr:hypothetical protein [Polyangia bacterium]
MARIARPALRLAAAADRAARSSRRTRAGDGSQCGFAPNGGCQCPSPPVPR